MSAASRKMLWGRAGNECAYPECPTFLLQDLADPETGILKSRGAVIGEEAHIRGEKPGSARHDPTYSDVDEYPNRILLCPTHHTVVDKENGAAWSVEALEKVKATHENAKDSLRDAQQQKKLLLEERLAASVEYWETDLLDDWQRFTSHLFQAYPRFRISDLELLMEKGAWLLAKDWPDGYPHMSAAFARWGFGVGQLSSWINESFETATVEETDWLQLVRGHKRLNRVDAQSYERLLEQFLRECVVTWALVVELTRATNLVIRAIRDDLDPLYRFNEGVILFRIPDLIGGDKLRRLEFEDVDWATVGLTEVTSSSVNSLVKREFVQRGLDRYDEIDPFSLDLTKHALVEGD